MNDYKDKFTKAHKKILTGHKKRVYTIDWLVNTNTILTGSVDTTIRSWDISNDSFTEFKHHSESITQIKSSPTDSNTFISASSDKHIKMWDIRTSKPIKDEKTKNGIKYLSINPTNQHLAFSNKESDLLYIYDINTFTQLTQIEFKSKRISEFAYDKTNSFLLLANNNTNNDTGCISLIDVNTYSILGSVPNANDVQLPQINSIDIDYSKGKSFITGSADALVVEWDVHEMLSRNVMKKTDQGIRKVAYNKNSDLCASICESGNVDVFECQSGINVYTVYSDMVQYSVMWNKNEINNKDILAYCGYDKNARNGEEGNVYLLIV